MPPRLTTPSLFSAPDLSASREETASSLGLKTSKSGSPEWIHAHCDGGARGNPGPSGYGALVQDAAGNVIAELSEFLGLRTNNYAEYSGLLGCLQYALDHGHARLKVVSDSELMVKQIQGKYQVKSPDLKPLYEEAKRRIARLEKFEISHALRHKNKDADRLANEAMDRGMKRPAPPAVAKAVPVTVAAKTETPPIPISLGGRPPRSGVEPQGTTSAPALAVPKTDAMMRGFTKDGVVHILGGGTLPDGVFVKIIRE